MVRPNITLLCLAMAVVSLSGCGGRSTSSTSSYSSSSPSTSSPDSSYTRSSTSTTGDTGSWSTAKTGTSWEQAKQEAQKPAGTEVTSAPNDTSTVASGSSDHQHSHSASHGTDVVPATNAPPPPAESLTKTPESTRKLSAEEQQYKQTLANLVLDPKLFKTKEYKDRPTVAPAYEIAKEHPDVLKRLFCYCGCDLTCSHTSLLDCFTATDRHGATCSECIDEAFLASKLIKGGATMARVQQIVDEQFCDKYPFRPNERTKTYTNYLANRLYTDSKDPICGNRNSYE